jgi:hypothetical protein
MRTIEKQGLSLSYKFGAIKVRTKGKGKKDPIAKEKSKEDGKPKDAPQGAEGGSIETLPDASTPLSK